MSFLQPSNYILSSERLGVLRAFIGQQGAGFSLSAPTPELFSCRPFRALPFDMTTLLCSIDDQSCWSLLFPQFPHNMPFFSRDETHRLLLSSFIRLCLTVVFLLRFASLWAQLDCCWPWMQARRPSCICSMVSAVCLADIVFSLAGWLMASLLCRCQIGTRSPGSCWPLCPC